MSRGIRLSAKHGVNPSLVVCWACGADAGLALMGQLPNDAEAPRRISTGMLCARCEDIAGRGVFVMEVEERPRDGEEPRRTGRLLALKDDAFREVFGNDARFVEAGLRRRAVYVGPTTFNALAAAAKAAEGEG